ncbi:MAG: hypothetical protein IJ428_01040 [Clostridia bacterium]|nr:hypothetical protein [Clostridia bacterium]
MLKRLSLIVVIVALFGSLLVSCQNGNNGTEVSEVKSVDIYIIAGQSNAGGYTGCDDLAIAPLWDKYNVGTPNVMYYGSSEYTYKNANGEWLMGVNKFSEWVPVRVGMGCDIRCIGPEVGMAAYLSENYYNGDNAGKTAGIIKYAHGGTSLFEASKSDHEFSGSWASPSYAATLESDTSEYTGRLYIGLINEVKSGVAALAEAGYNDINIKGVFWMQGETDKNSPDEYKTAFEYFVSDLRRDLGEIMVEDLSALPVMVGEISETSGSALKDAVDVNNGFIEMQRSLADEIENVYIVPSGQYKINWMEGSFSKNHGDPWHWKTTDIFAIGEMVGECIVEEILSGTVDVETNSLKG